MKVQLNWKESSYSKLPELHIAASEIVSDETFEQMQAHPLWDHDVIQKHIQDMRSVAGGCLLYTSCVPYQRVVGTLCSGDEKGVGNQYVSDAKCIIAPKNRVRRLTPLECERLQGFPDGWTDIPDASDTARYKALGNSVAVPCVETVLAAVQNYLRQEEKD